MLIYQVSIVSFSSLKNADLIDGFNWGFSCGDAANTLMRPEDLINDLEHSDEDGAFQPLINELLTIPAGILVGFDC